jgi:signal transduction histidine kinase
MSAHLAPEPTRAEAPEWPERVDRPMPNVEDFAPPWRGRSGGTIGRRIVRTLAIPVAVAFLLLAVITVIQVSDYRAASATSRAVTLDLAVQDLVQQLQDERGVTAGLLGGNVGFKAELAASRKRVDDQRAKVQKLISSGGAVDDRVAAAVRQLDGLAGVRAGTDTGSGARAATFNYYTARISALLHVDFGLDSSTDATLRKNVAAFEALSDLKEATAQERAFLNGVFSASGFKGTEFLQFVTMSATRDAALAAFNRNADKSETAGKDYVYSTGAAEEATYFEKVALASGDGRYLVVNPQSWWSALTTVLDDMLQLQQHTGSVIQARASDLQNTATLRTGGLLAAVLIALLGSVYLATVASRSIARPLAALADEANRMASEQLPEAVQRATAGEEGSPPPPVHVARGASDEVRLVADAFDRVRDTAYSLATEQASLRRSSAESLANLGRRNQNLLRRQLGFLTRLEREESDPTGLANLFELDHLATRMRRNAESLLVLVGAASPRQWSEPLPVSDVIRAAVSEVEEYRRVTLRRVDEALVAGSVVSGIAHMLAELIENGLTFSPPDVDLEIHGRRIGDGYLIAVFDQGVGLSAPELARANERLRGEGDFITAPARFLGHYVVGRLAVEMGIKVELTPSPVTGVTARITLPASILAEQSAVEGGRQVARQTTPAVPRHARREFDPDAPGLLRLPPGMPAAAMADEPLRPATVESVVVAGSLSVPSQRGSASVPPQPGNTPYEAAKQPSALGVNLYTFEPAADAGERTTNGLRKRNPRVRRNPNTGTHPTTLVSTTAEDRSDPVNDSPDALRARLSAFRDGVQRGSSETGGQ